MNVCSLFCGIGGIDIAFKNAGFDIVFANDNDKFACKTYSHNFPDVNLVNSNIEDVNKSTIPNFDVLISGFPCQPFSVCGEKKGFSDKRGNAFFEICKILDEKKPTIIFLENVANLAEHDDGKTFNVIHNELSQRDYYIRYIIADACEYGLPQHRTRTYIIAFLDKDKCDRFCFPVKNLNQSHIENVIDFSACADSKYYIKADTTIYTRLNTEISDSKQLYRFADYGIQRSRDGIAFTIKANMGTYPNRIPIIRDSFGIRYITPYECLSLQGFPAKFVFPDDVLENERYKQAGNTVCVPLISMLANSIFKLLNENYTNPKSIKCFL